MLGGNTHSQYSRDSFGVSLHVCELRETIIAIKRCVMARRVRHNRSCQSAFVGCLKCAIEVLASTHQSRLTRLEGDAIAIMFFCLFVRIYSLLARTFRQTRTLFLSSNCLSFIRFAIATQVWTHQMTEPKVSQHWTKRWQSQIEQSQTSRAVVWVSTLTLTVHLSVITRIAMSNIAVCLCFSQILGRNELSNWFVCCLNRLLNRVSLIASVDNCLINEWVSIEEIRLRWNMT